MERTPDVPCDPVNLARRRGFSPSIRGVEFFMEPRLSLAGLEGGVWFEGFAIPGLLTTRGRGK